MATVSNRARRLSCSRAACRHDLWLHIQQVLARCTFGDQSLSAVTLPGGLWTLTFGTLFYWSLKGAALPSSPSTLTSGHGFFQMLGGVTLPTCRHWLSYRPKDSSCSERTLASGSTRTCMVSSSCHAAQWPADIDLWLQVQPEPAPHVMPPGSLQTLTFGYRLNTSLHGDDSVQPSVGFHADIDLYRLLRPVFICCVCVLRGAGHLCLAV